MTYQNETSGDTVSINDMTRDTINFLIKLGQHKETRQQAVDLARSLFTPRCFYVSSSNIE